MSNERIPTQKTGDKKSEANSSRSAESMDQRKFVYPVTESKYPYSFYMEDGGVYLSVHFDGERFRHPETKEEISIHDFLNEMKADLHANKIVLSCCYPDAAKKIIGEVSGVTILGSGNCEVQTKYNNKRKVITVKFHSVE